MRAIALVVVLVLAFVTVGCNGGDAETPSRSERDPDYTAVAFQPYQCQAVIEGSAQVRRAVEENEPELLAHLIQLRQFYDASRRGLRKGLRDDFETVLEPEDGYWRAVSLGGPSPAPQILQPVLDDIDQPESLAAATRINTWANEDC